MVVIRMARGGRSKRPYFGLVAADSRAPRDGRFLEKLGRYNPRQPAGKTLSGVRTEAIAAWVAKGAILSDTVRTLLKSNGIEFDATSVQKS